MLLGIIFPFLCFQVACAQAFAIKDHSIKNSSISGPDTSRRMSPPDVLNSGFLDIITNGQVSASARLIRIYIGEPGKLRIPLSIYSGVTSTNLGSQSQPGTGSNEHLVSGFINPFSGLLNVSLEEVIYYADRLKVTNGAFTCQVGGRVLSGFRNASPANPLNGKPINFFNTYVVAGIYFQTGAWEKSNARNLGLFWMSLRYICSYSDPKALQPLLTESANGLYHGWSVGGGIEINSLINVKVLYYKYAKEPEFGFVTPFCQFSFHYALKK